MQTGYIFNYFGQPWLTKMNGGDTKCLQYNDPQHGYSGDEDQA